MLPPSPPPRDWVSATASKKKASNVPIALEVFLFGDIGV
jgi:hypothetical protein